ncbi:hypothetical protein [Paludisphaera sp.]|uniref:hypothetical protein n=1 Tax=Paludisphaera sp. TaxID=2017432 RepID=UPI00301D6DCB
MTVPVMLRRLVVALAIGLALAPAASACPSCKEAVASQPSDAALLSRGFAWSIVLMLAVPTALATAGGLAVRRAVKRGILPEL